MIREPRQSANPPKGGQPVTGRKEERFQTPDEMRAAIAAVTEGAAS